jgi:hypothetical protein
VCSDTSLDTAEANIKENSVIRKRKHRIEKWERKQNYADKRREKLQQ